MRGLAGWLGRLVFPHRGVELVVDDGVLLVGAGREGESCAGLHLQRHVPGNIEEDRVAATRGSHQDGDLLRLTGLHGWRGPAGFGLLGLRCGGVGSHASRGRVDRQEHLLRTNLRYLQTPRSVRQSEMMIRQPVTCTLRWYRVFRRELAWSNSLFGIASVTCLQRSGIIENQAWTEWTHLLLVNLIG